MRYSSVICCQFEQSRKLIPSDHRARMRVTGSRSAGTFFDFPRVPRRRLAWTSIAFTHWSSPAPAWGSYRQRGDARTGGDDHPQRLANSPSRRTDHGEHVRGGYREKNIAARVIDFTADMADVWAVADLAISRSGASSFAELTACGVPSILMPYPFHKDLHQRANAKVLADAGAAVLMDDGRTPGNAESFGRSWNRCCTMFRVVSRCRTPPRGSVAPMLPLPWRKRFENC